LPRSKKSRRQIAALGKTLTDLARSREPGLFEGAQSRPFEMVQAWPGLTVTLVDEPEVGQGCSVSGAYFYERGQIVVSRSASRRRRNFTALHELAHHLQEHDQEFISILEEEPDAGKALEDDICDAFAAEVLLPEDVVNETVGPKGPTAENVIELFEKSQASREACCVRAAQRIMGDGYVMLCDLSPTALFTAATSQYRIRRNTPQAQNEVIEAAIRWGNAKRESRVGFASGAQSQRFFGHAVRNDDYVFGVFVSYSPAWVKGLTPSLSEPNHPLGAQGD
jgi:Zn-dependent peptidase ImmA (M78 family)